MKMKLRNGTLVEVQDNQERILKLLYGTLFGRILLKPLTMPWISNMAGRFLSTEASCVFIKPFIKKNHIDMSQFEEKEYESYNEFFSRKIREGARVIDMNPKHLISPCDCKLTAVPIRMDRRFTLKHTEYTVASLLKNKALAKDYDGGYAMIFRLTVDDYHRYCYIADGTKSDNVFLHGVLHTVNPIANDFFPIYKENSREYTVLHTKEFGDVVMMEVGALLVGKIVNHHRKAKISRGQEKGYFQFGGSTIVLLLKKNTVQVDKDILRNSQEGIETVVRMGEKIGVSVL